MTAIRVVSEKVVLADWLFTTPAIITQAATGLALTAVGGYPLSAGWVMAAIVLYLFAVLLGAGRPAADPNAGPGAHRRSTRSGTGPGILVPGAPLVLVGSAGVRQRNRDYVADGQQAEPMTGIMVGLALL